MKPDLHSATVDAAAALAEDEPLLGDDLGNVFPGDREDGPLIPYVSSLTPGIVRKPCAACGTARVPHVGVEIGCHGTPAGKPCAAGTVRFG